MTLRLCVTADDYGLDPSVNEGIEALAAERRIDAVSVMVHPHAVLGEARRLAADGVATGLHLVFVGERPLCTGRLAEALDAEGRLPAHYGALFALLLRRPWLLPRFVEEAHAQVDRYLALGLPLVFFNSHQHVHQFPPLWRALGPVFRRVPGAAVRCARTGPLAWSRQGALHLAARMSWRGWPLPGTRVLDGVGVDFAGHADEAAVARMLGELAQRRVPADVLHELILHPGLGVPADAAHRRWGYCWRDEYALLASGALDELLARRGVRRVRPLS
jgi:predicted glycoside hydrolase/deacetylase ChbG (UPF0249 family)